MLSRESSYMYLGNDWSPIARVNDSLALQVKTFDMPEDAIAETRMVAAEGVEPEETPPSGDSGSSNDLPVVAVPVAPGSGAGEGAAVAAPGTGQQGRGAAREIQLREAICGTKNELWVRLSKAEAREQAKLDAMAQLERRHAAATDGAPVLAPRIVKTPTEPTAIERAEHMVTHTPQQP